MAIKRRGKAKPRQQIRKKSGKVRAKKRAPVAARKRGKVAKRGAARKPVRKAKPKRISSLAKAVLDRFRRRKGFRKLGDAKSPKNTVHKWFSASLDKTELQDFTKSHRNKAGFLTIEYTDKEGMTRHISTRVFLLGSKVDAADLLKDLYRVLYQYNTAKEIDSVDDVGITVFGNRSKSWDSRKKWKGGQRPTTKRRKPARKARNDRTRKARKSNR